MGVWGNGNFQCDAALDFVDGIVERLAKEIDCWFAKGRARPIDLGESHVVPSVAIIVAICEQCEATPPPSEAVASWRAKYLLLFDEWANHSPASGEFLAARRQVVEETFAILERVAAGKRQNLS